MRTHVMDHQKEWEFLVIICKQLMPIEQLLQVKMDKVGLDKDQGHQINQIR